MGNSPVVIGQPILWVQFDGFVEIRDRLPVITQVGTGNTAIHIGQCKL